MLDEYILGKLEEIDREKEELTNELVRLSEEENAQNMKIERLMEQEDVGMELFSPRTDNKPLKVQVEDIRLEIQAIKDKEAIVMDKLEKNAENEKRYQEFLQEARTNPDKEEEKDPEKAEENIANDELIRLKAETNRELEVLLKRIETCISLVHKDRTKCKNELKNLKYYVMAMISRQNQ